MKEDNKVATYGHHFHQYAEMIGAPNVHSVFEYLLDCYMSNIRTGRDGEFRISVSNIALRRVITRDTVRASINALLKMKLISIDGKKCTVNADMYVSLIYCYIGLEAEEEKKKFRNALGEGDYIVLEELGLQVLCDCKGVLLEQKGNLTNIRQFESEMTNISQFDEGQSVKLTNIRQLEGSDEKVANIRQNSIELANIRQFDFENCLKFVSLASINCDFLKKQIEACVENGLKKFILTNIRQFMPELEEDPMFLSSLDVFCDGSFNIIDPWVAIFRHFALKN